MLWIFFFLFLFNYSCPFNLSICPHLSVFIYTLGILVICIIKLFVNTTCLKYCFVRADTSICLAAVCVMLFSVQSYKRHSLTLLLSVFELSQIWVDMGTEGVLRPKNNTFESTTHSAHMLVIMSTWINTMNIL